MPSELMDFDESEPVPEALAALRAAPVAVNGDDVPPAGTPCAPCRGLKHWCPAKCYRSGEDGRDEPICLACAAGQDCDRVKTQLRRLEVTGEQIAETHLDRPPAPARHIEVAADKRVVAETPRVSRMPYVPQAGGIRVKVPRARAERYEQPVRQMEDDVEEIPEQPVTEKPGFYVTDQECACGCGTLMDSGSVRAGWRYIGGHKLRAEGAPVKAAKTGTARTTAVGIEQVRQFLESNDKLIAQQLAAARDRLEQLRIEANETQRKIDKLMAERPKFRDALRALGPAGAVAR